MLLIFLGAALIALMLFDGFEAMLVTRRVAQRLRPSRLFFRASWWVWSRASTAFRQRKHAERFLSVYGPLCMVVLFAVWALGLILGFALIHGGLKSPLNPKGQAASLGEYAYLSGVTFFTLGFGDLTAADATGRALTVFEAGVGFASLAIAISYLPVLYAAFARRESTISLLDARAGSPPTAAQLFARLGPAHNDGSLAAMLGEWERWSAELLESHITYPVLAYYRSQHDNQSWLASLAMILDASALALTTLPDGPTYQARLTFAMARHAAVDLAQVLRLRPDPEAPARIDETRWACLRAELAADGWALNVDRESYAKLAELRALYEPFLLAMGVYLRLFVPPILDPVAPVDNWRTSAWMRRAGKLRDLAADDATDDHRD